MNDDKHGNGRDYHANMHSVRITGFPLCVRCRSCGRRRALSADAIGARDGDMTMVRDVRLVCGGCGTRDVERFRARSQAIAVVFVDGDERNSV